MFLCVPINVKKLDTDIYVHVKEDGKKILKEEIHCQSLGREDTYLTC